MYVKVQGKFYKVHEDNQNKQTYFIVRSKKHKQHVSDPPSQFIRSLPGKRRNRTEEQEQEREQEREKEEKEQEEKKQERLSILEEENAQFRRFLTAAKNEIEVQQKENERLTALVKELKHSVAKSKSPPENHTNNIKLIKHLKQQVLKLSSVEADLDELTIEYERIYNENIMLKKKH